MSDAEAGRLEIEPGQEWDVDMFRPEDAEGVTALFRTVYGAGYPIQTFIDPERLIEENAAGRTISSVARTVNGDIVGHNALFNSAPWNRLYESGAGLVHPAYRGGRGIFTGMVRHGIDVAAKAFPVSAIFGEPVCNHLFSQKMTEGQGWVFRALEVDLMPAASYVQEGSATGRVSALLAFLAIQPRPQTVYLPAVYREALEFCYTQPDEEREFRASEADVPEGPGTTIRTQVFDFAQVARLAVWESGSDFASVFDREEQRVLAAGASVIQVWLKLSWPWVGRIVDVLRDRGYFFGGALLRWFDDDGLLMQRIVGRPSWNGIVLASDRARALVDLVRADWERTSARP